MNISIRAAVIGCAMAAALSAAELVLPSSVLSRDGIVTVTFRMSRQITGSGTYAVRWTDSLNRVVEDRSVPIHLTDEAEFSFPVDLRRAVAMKNTLHVHLLLGDSTDMKHDLGPKEEDAEAEFVARPPGKQWTDYVVIMWQQYPGNLIPALEKLGINGGQYLGRSQSPPDFFIDNNVRWYSENIGTDFYSEYHRYRPDRIQSWSFLQAKALHEKDPSGLEAFKRHPSFWDPVWRKRIHDRAVAAAKRNMPYRPFFYSLGDESGIADLAAFWDFDFSDESLVAMRRWLREQYGSLDALNRQWGTTFATWDLVTPPTTHEAMQRTDGNFSAWADFKNWMDISYADALKMGREAIEEVDPDAYVGIGGGQMPGWGGYDYSRITKALTEIEPYDIGNNIEIIRSLNPQMPMLTTGFASGDWEKQRVWHELFHGNRGLIIWDEKHAYVGENGQPGPRGAAAGEYYNEIRDGIGALIINSHPINDPIAIHYSQPSMRTEWMLARQPEGDAWIHRNARAERTDNAFLRLRESWCQMIEDQGMQYKFVSYDQVEHDELLKGGYRIFVLPHSSALSPAEASAIREFVSAGGVAIADGEPGTFDEHSRRLSEPQLADLFEGSHDQAVNVRSFGKGRAIFLNAATLMYQQNRLMHKEGPVHELIGELLRSNGIHPEITVTDASGKPVAGIELHLYRNGGSTIITLLSNPQLRVDELGPPDFKSNSRFENPVTVTVGLAEPLHLYDVRAKKSLGVRRSLVVTVNPYEPVVLTAAPSAFAPVRISVPARVQRGALVRVGVSCRPSPASLHVFHIDVIDPQGQRVIAYSGNLLAKDGRGMKLLPLAENDRPGHWTLRVHDLLSGQTAEAPLAVD